MSANLLTAIENFLKQHPEQTSGEVGDEVAKLDEKDLDEEYLQLANRLNYSNKPVFNFLRSVVKTAEELLAR